MPKILIVEDEIMNRDMLARRLAWEGYVVAIAASGEGALSTVRDEAPNLILMDLGLPGLSGWEAARILKNDPATAHIPIIALSAFAFAEDRTRALEAGCDDFEIKPILFKRLLLKIDQLLLGRLQ
ncbi:chemotaxis protein CheY [Kouleothrix aurantiaca]|jgi:CheY-like chemotaxis protein|uniref:Chemotaxis protein CheY n=1 Tax=Kouleothrix aurantiaca TaxID=186479 RepID=A0A0P9DIL6_9CHLR|nr:chemotaxis protein CheY [Kouleothrix aurantiaca]